jgi:Ulp1 family protease
LYVQDIEDENFHHSLDVKDMKKCSRPIRFNELSDIELNKVKEILDGTDNERLIIEKFNIPITQAKISCLQHGVWLNDEVSFYVL